MEEVLIKFGYRMPLNSFDFIKIKWEIKWNN
jgi:hypothetical protein